MIQTSKNDKKPNFGPDFGPFNPNLGPQFFCRILPLDIVASYHPMQFKEILINQTWKNGKKTPNFGADFGPFWPTFGSKKFFSWVLSSLEVIHCCKLSLHTI